MFVSPSFELAKIFVKHKITHYRLRTTDSDLLVILESPEKPSQLLKEELIHWYGRPVKIEWRPYTPEEEVKHD